MGGGGEIAGLKLFAPPNPSRQGKSFCAPPFKEWKLVASPPTIWLKLQATAKTLLQNFLCPPFSMAKTFSAFS